MVHHYNKAFSGFNQFSVIFYIWSGDDWYPRHSYHVVICRWCVWQCYRLYQTLLDDVHVGFIAASFVFYIIYAMFLY